MLLLFHANAFKLKIRPLEALCFPQGTFANHFISPRREKKQQASQFSSRTKPTTWLTYHKNTCMHNHAKKHVIHACYCNTQKSTWPMRAIRVQYTVTRPTTLVRITHARARTTPNSRKSTEKHLHPLARMLTHKHRRRPPLPAKHKHTHVKIQKRTRPMHQTTIQWKCLTMALNYNFDYELFNCNNFNIRYWSWNYRGCWHQTCPPIVSSTALNRSHANCNDPVGPASSFLVTTSLCQDWVICAPAAFLGCGSRFSGSLSGIEP